MNSRITLGRYVPGNSFIHRLDPRLKILALIGLLVAVFFPLTYIQYTFLVVCVLIMLGISKTSLKSIFKSLKMMWFTILLLLIINAFVVKTGAVLFTIGTFEFHVNALTQTLMIFVRLFLMICLTTILTTTTTPLELTNAIEWYFSPLKVIKFPAHEIAMTISIALRFIPTLLEETEKIIKAQASRGVDLKNGKLKEKINGVISLIIPLFVSSFQRSEELADAMEARGYNPSAKRTKYRQLKFTFKDVVGFVLTAAICFITIFSIYNPTIKGYLDSFTEYLKNLW